MMIESIRIPGDRKAVLIGRNGKVKKEIEKFTGAKITVGEEICISGDIGGALKAAEIVKAIGRGFAPENALDLLDDERSLDVISLKGSLNQIKRISSRVIGRAGAARKNIEMLTGAFISVYGKTISIIGKASEVKSARRAVEMLIGGRSHNYVYKRLEKAISYPKKTTISKQPDK